MPKFHTADLCDDNNLVIVSPIFTSYGANTHCSGRIMTVRAIEDNSYVKKLLETDGEGCVMVVDGEGSDKCALMGDNLAALAAENNWSGIIINGYIRDSEEINKIPISIKAIGSIPARGSSKSKNFGLDAKALAISTLLLSPPDKVKADAFLIWSKENSFSNSFKNSLFCLSLFELFN